MFTSDELNRIKIFSCLEETERIWYAEKAADVRLCAGEWLIREGEPPGFSSCSRAGYGWRRTSWGARKI